MGNFRTVAINTGAQYFSRIAIIALSILTTGILTRTLDKTDYGRFGLISTIIIFFTTIADWGTQSITVREISRNPSNSQKLFSQSLVLRTTVALLATISFVVTVILYPPFAAFKQTALLATPLILILSLKTSALILHQSSLRLYFPALAEVTTNLSFILLISVSLIRNGTLTLPTVIMALVVGSFINTVVSITPILHVFRFSSPQITQLKSIIRESLPMGAFLVVFSVYNRVDSFILQYFHGDATTGSYLLSYKIHENLVLLAAYLMNSLYPLISRDQSHARQIFTTLFPLFVVLASLVLAIGFIAAPLIIRILAGVRYQESAPLLQILLFATAFSYLNHLTGYTLVALKKQSISLLFALLAFVLNISLNLSFVPHYSYVGSAIVTVLTEGLVFVLTFFFLARHFRYTFKPSQIIDSFRFLLERFNFRQ